MAELIEDPYCQEFTLKYNDTISVTELIDQINELDPANDRSEETYTGPSPSSQTFDHQLDIHLRKTVSVFMKTHAKFLSKTQINTVSFILLSLIFVTSIRMFT